MTLTLTSCASLSRRLSREVSHSLDECSRRRRRRAPTLAPTRAATSPSSASSATDEQRRIALVTGSTDGIGLHTACTLAANGHGVIVHGRSQTRVDEAVARIQGVSAGGGGVVGAYVRDFSSLAEVQSLARDVLNNHPRLDVLDNNAGMAFEGEGKWECGRGVEGRELPLFVVVILSLALSCRTH